MRMGYTTDFYGTIEVVPPLNESEIDFLERFATCRRVNRKSGPYYASEDPEVLKNFGQDWDEDTISLNEPHPGEPNFFCQWTPTEDGAGIEWDGGEKFYDAEDWMYYLIKHFIGSDPEAKKYDPERFSFLQGHTCNGEIEAQGEDPDDKWLLKVTDNVVTVHRGVISYAETGVVVG
jgi:hypothetical protein